MSRSRFGSHLRALAALVLLAPLATAQGVRILSPQGGPAYADIQSAVDAAPDGGVVLVGSGTYPRFTIVNKALTVVSDPNGGALVTGPVAVTSIAAGKHVELIGLAVHSTSVHEPALSVTNCQGQTRFQFCIFEAPLSGTGGHSQSGGPNCFGTPIPAQSGARVQASTHVAFYWCQFIGGRAIDYFFTEQDMGPDGGHGLHVLGSSVALYDCDLNGGKGGAGGWCAGDGGNGCLSDGPFLYSARSFFRGGDATMAADHFSNGSPANGLRMNAGTAVLLANGLQGGWTPWPPGGFAAGYGGDASFEFAAVVPRAAFAYAVAPAGSMQDLVLEGEVGDAFYLGFGTRPIFRYVPAWFGFRFLPVPVMLSVVPTAVLAERSVAVPVRVPLATAGSAATRFVAQCFVRSTQGEWRSTNPLHIVVIDPLSGPDCDANGICDYLDVVQGSSPDFNHNLVPDTCPGG